MRSDQFCCLLPGWLLYPKFLNIFLTVPNCIWSYTPSMCNWAPSNEFVSSSIPSWQNLTAHAQPFRGARDLAFCLKVPLDSLLVWASSEGSGETARMRRLAWTFAARIGYKYQIRLTWQILICGRYWFYLSKGSENGRGGSFKEFIFIVPFLTVLSWWVIVVSAFHQ